MKKLLALFLLASSVAYASHVTPEYTVKIDSETIVVTEAQGAIITLPRTAVAVLKEDKEVIYAVIALIGAKGSEPIPVALAVLDSQCNAKKGNIAVMDTALSKVLSMVTYDEEKHEKSPAFVASYLCKMGKGQGKATTKNPLPLKGAI